VATHPKRRPPHRPKTISAQGITGQRGINLIENILLEMGSRWTASGPNEVGIDGYIELFDPSSRESLGLTLAVQSKVVSAIGEAGPTFEYRCDVSDLEYWLRGNTPVILIVSNPPAGEAYWVWIQSYFEDWTPSVSTRVTFVKSQNRFDTSSLKQLAEIAAPRKGLYLAPTRRQETLWSNLLIIETLAPRIFIGITECRAPRDVWAILNKSKHEPDSGWVLWEKKIVSFDDLTTGPWPAICDRGTVESFETSEWSQPLDQQRQRLFVQLLNQTLKVQLNFRARYWPNEDCFAIGGKPRKLPYRSLKRNSQLSVVSAYSSKAKDGRVFSYLRHLAFRGQFRRFDDNWYLEITPTYRFTNDGLTLDRFHESRLKRIKEIEGNRAVLSAVLYWAYFLRPKIALFAKTPLQFGELLCVPLDVGVDDKSWLKNDPDFVKDEDPILEGLFSVEPTEESDE
jgi:hypothetical protein